MQPLLKQDPQQSTDPANNEEYEQDETSFDDGDGGDSDFTIDSDQIEEAIKKQLDGTQSKALNRILDAGNQLLFGKDTHYDVMEGLTDDDDTRLADELGKGGISLATMLFEKSGGTMPQELIIPAGVILLARVSEFLAKTGHKINDEIFHEATMTFNLGLMQKTDPEFHDRVKSLMDQGMDIIQAQEVAIKERQDGGGVNADNSDINVPQKTQQQPGLLGAS